MPLAPLQSPAALALGTALSGVRRGVGEVRNFLETLQASLAVSPPPEGNEGATAEESAEGGQRLALLSAEATALLEDFGAQLRQRLERAGVDTKGPFELSFDRQSGLRITGGHPQAQEIAALLQSDDELADQFRLLAAAFAAIHEVEQVDDLHERYGLNSVLAADHYARIVGESTPPSFHVQIRGNDVEARVE